jgi:hypothetical protein
LEDNGVESLDIITEVSFEVLDVYLNSEKTFNIVCIPLTFSDIRTVSSAYNKKNILR